MFLTCSKSLPDSVRAVLDVVGAELVWRCTVVLMWQCTMGSE